MRVRNSNLHALETCLGTETALLFCALFGSRTANLWIPKRARESSHIASLIGVPAMEKLAQRFGGGYLRVPTLHAFRAEIQDDFIRGQLVAGVAVSSIAAEVGLSVARVRQIRRWARVRPATVRTEAVYRAALPSRLKSVCMRNAWSVDVSREALGFFELFSPPRSQRKKAQSPRTHRTDVRRCRVSTHPLDAWAQAARHA